jgi:hypothetical protein
MREEPLLTVAPPAPMKSLPEFYAIAFDQAQKAAQRYGALAARIDESFWPVRCVFEVLTSRERDRAENILAACVAACGRRPDLADLRWTPIDLVPAKEIADIGDSRLSTPYAAWALAVRHRQRTFVFWTYVIALAENPSVRKTAEDMAREALSDGNLLRRERRLAWRSERQLAVEEASKTPSGTGDFTSSALLESLLLKDIIAWSQELPSGKRDHLLALGVSGPPPRSLAAPAESDAASESVPIEQIKRRALRHAEQLSKIYLDDADSAADQSSMELAQNLAARSIMRLAGLRAIASVPDVK